MESFTNPIPDIQDAKHKDELLYNSYALRRMLQRDLSVDCVKEALDCPSVEILENYPKIGRPSPECLMLGVDDTGKAVHILVAYPVAEVITAYEPTLPRWVNPRERAKR
jgi:hypothetical protein